MVLGYAGNILRADLTTGTCTFEPVDPKIARAFVGGAGYAAALMYKEVPAGIDPLGPENKLIFATSPLANNRVPGGGSIMICFKSPQTGVWGESRAGGNFGPDMRKAGADFIVCEGASQSPRYLLLVNGVASLEDASDLVGKDIYEKTDILENRHPKSSVMVIGQGGENKVGFASIMYHDRAAGRCGGGAVMGSKNLLAVVVLGPAQPAVADKKAFSEATKEAMRTVRANPVCSGFNEFGTVGDMAGNDEDGDWPTKNWRSNNWGKGAELFDAFQSNNLVSSKQCYTGCPIGCGRVCQVKEGPYKTPVHEGAEYESVSTFTSYIMNEDMDIAIYCGYLCNRWGIDTISAGAMVAFAMECHEHGILTSDDANGLDLSWGNSAMVPELLKMIAFREGLGNILAEGVRKAAQIIGKGSEAFAIHVKGLEGAAHDPRSGKLLGVAYGTANRGMCHIHPLEGMAFDRGKMSWGMQNHGASDPEQCDRWDEEGKGTQCAILQRGLILPDILCTCKFMCYAGINPEHWASMLSAATGWDMDAKELILVGERSHNLQRLFNMREGLRRADDRLPKRVLSKPEFGAYQDTPECATEDFEALLDEYYTACGWDLTTGIPTNAKLESLGLPHFEG